MVRDHRGRPGRHLGEAAVGDDRQPARQQLRPLVLARDPHGEAEVAVQPFGLGARRQLPPGQLGPVPGLRHRLARRHRQPGVQPQHGRPRGRRFRRPRIVQVGPRHLQPGEVGGPLVDGHGRVDADLGRPVRHGDPGQRARPLPGRAPRPPDYLPDPRVLPGARRRGPLTVRLGDPGVGQKPQHRPRRAFQRVGPGRRRGPLNPDDKRQRVLPPLVPAGSLHRRRRLRGRGVFFSHPSSMSVR